MMLKGVKTMLIIREEIPVELPAIREVIKKAFEQNDEARVVEEVREACDEILSLVALKGEEIVGHLFFSPAMLKNENVEIKGMGLAPLAVTPKEQNKGVGKALMEKGLQILRERGYPFIIVLGHNEYYKKFGFVQASYHNINSQWEDVPEEAFMIYIIDRELITGISGTAFYREEFEKAV